MAVIVLLEIATIEEASSGHEIRLALYDDQGEVVKLPGTSSPGFGATMEPNPDVEPQLPLAAPVVIHLVGVPLDPDHMYEWRVAVDGEENPLWRSSFMTTRQPPPNSGD
jgi:hypothetical protein